ncbi:MAG: flagellar hook-length control protein FliK [Sulfurospirillaceae bacterium]|nr:flagellar hook-length control protein FliK [Sulfurospirillaceae bacterium]MDD2825293.1 flagellar hook-length control protein FliK [Sulfurospirillaceae bacterium]
MPDVTSFVKAQSPLSLAMSGESKKSDSAKSNDMKDTKSFISIMLAQLMDNQSSTKTTTKNVQKELTSEETLTETKKTKASTKDAKSVDEHLLDDMLKIFSALKNGTQDTIFPTLKSSSSRLEKVLNNEVALKEFSEVKNITDLLALSKKYNLGLDKLTFSQEKIESLEKTFPQLTQNNFFDNADEISKISQEEVESFDKTPSISPLEKKNVQNEKSMEPSSALKDFMSKESVEKPKVEVKITQTTDINSDNKKQSTEEIKVIVEENLSNKKSTPTPTEIAVQKAAIPITEEKKVDTKIKVEIPTKTSEKSEEIEVKTPSVITRINEPKIDNSTTNSKGLTEAILQTIKLEKPLPTKGTEPVQVATPITSSSEEIVSENNEDKHTNNDLKVEIKSTQKQELTVKQTVTTSKESLNQFANDLREKIENYKPPIMKVELALNPKNLGEVDVTLLTRGNNLHVNISSNSNTMSLFTQNQAEFKNALVNMGFTNLEMNFSDQQKNEQQQNHSKNNTKNLEDLGEDAFNETLTTVELVVPRYV